MEEALVAFLLADAALAALVVKRINWQTRPQGEALPAIVLQRVSGVRDYAMAGPTGLVESRVQVDCWGKTHASALAVARRVRALLSGLRTEVSGTQLQGTFVLLERHSFEKESDGAQALHRVMMDFQIWHSE